MTFQCFLSSHLIYPSFLLSFYDFLSRNQSSLSYPSIYPSSIHGNMRVSLRAASLWAALRPAGPVLCQCQISTHVWSSSDTSSIHPSTLIPSLPPLFLLSLTSLSFSSAVSSSKGRSPPLHRPWLIFHFQITVAHSCVSTLLFLALSFLQCTERQTQQREAETQWACWHIRGCGVWEAEASVALKWERTSLISNLKLPCSHLWPSLNSLTQAIHRLILTHTNKCVTHV